MKSQKFFFLAVVLLLESCAAGYHAINPPSLNYQSQSSDKSVTLDYKYGVLSKRYANKALKSNIQLAAVKIVNNSDRDLVFGKDITLAYSNNNSPLIVKTDDLFGEVKQGVPIYLLYLLLTPAMLNTSSSDGETSSSSSTPIGLVLGPGLAGGNMIAAGSANSNFHNELTQYDLTGVTIKKGQTVYGLIGIASDSADALKVVVK
jgi:hypothetical protein